MERGGRRAGGRGRGRAGRGSEDDLSYIYLTAAVDGEGSFECSICELDLSFIFLLIFISPSS